MNYFYLLFLLMIISPIIRSINLYIPGFGSIVYVGLMIYMFYTSYKRTQQVRGAQFRGYSRSNNQQYHSTSYTSQGSNTRNQTASKVKPDVIDVEFSEREVQ